jgi:hypothetical protein
VILSGIEMVHMMRKQQAKYACSQPLSLAEQFGRLVAWSLQVEQSSFCRHRKFATEPRALDGIPDIAALPDEQAGPLIRRLVLRAIEAGDMPSSLGNKECARGMIPGQESQNIRKFCAPWMIDG